MSVLYQDKIWVDQEGTTWNISDMDTSHIENLLAYLERRQESMKFFEELQMIRINAQGDAASDALDRALDSLLQTETESWFADLPLVKELRSELKCRS